MTGSTLGYLAANGGKVRWRCDTGHGGKVDLSAMIADRGEDHDLADTWPPCPLCPGVITFTDGNSLWPRDLTRLKVNSAEWWAHTQTWRLALEAAGWRVRMGKWIGPETAKAPAPATGPGLNAET
ncbi:hypothetical protein [Brevundimonas subvibrioides]|uniref:Uncharacterized protein n=1 Tax=Brevundimonas subvibrioides (strain ATCC 15264 / DSM 4735 / LMG 14903 / NBRC 16000 / CB 81) TaxID=633149 RepID=D9QHU1_BRESC|nr:hypothetical protein [Brevundimonas subvibrioides]ADK99366.1 hypothetical protein Bresu_0051 [Brevundimonas subvibrioides ATCC 15264]